MNDPIFETMDLFSSARENYCNTKPIKLIEFFAGIGAQAKALEILGVDFIHHKTCEWAYNSIIAYNAIHIKDNTDYSKGMTKQDLIDYLSGNISTNYNEPCDVSKKSEEWLRTCYNSCIANHNLMNVMKVKGRDLDFDYNTLKDYQVWLSYSFPCQDLSLAGKREGMGKSQAEGGTRSGLLWEIERILAERERESLPLPNVLIMENVPEVIGSKNLVHFQKWETRLQKLGYTNYFKVINAKDYCIPQSRKRCFMISILGEYAYDFPHRINLKYKLKDFLEKDVEEKYFLSKKMVNYIANENEKWTGNNEKSLVNKDIASTLNTAEGTRRCDASNYVCDDLPDNYDLKEIKHPKILIKNATKKGYLEAEKGDGIDISGRMEYHRGTVQKGISQTLTTAGGNGVGVVVNVPLLIEEKRPNYDYGNKSLRETLAKNEIGYGEYIDCYNRSVKKDLAGTITTRVSQSNEVFVAVQPLKTQLCNKLIVEGKVQEGDVIRHSYSTNCLENGDKNMGRIENHEGLFPTLCTRCDCLGIVVDESTTKRDKNYITWRNKKGEFNTECNRASLEDDLSLTIPTKDQTKVAMSEEGNKLRIRKLTPCECIMLMGFTKEDYKAMKEAGLSDMAIYHCAGDSIVSTCLVALFSVLLNKNHKAIIENYVEDLINEKKC